MVYGTFDGTAVLGTDIKLWYVWLSINDDCQDLHNVPHGKGLTVEQAQQEWTDKQEYGLCFRRARQGDNNWENGPRGCKGIGRLGGSRAVDWGGGS